MHPVARPDAVQSLALACQRERSEARKGVGLDASGTSGDNKDRSGVFFLLFRNSIVQHHVNFRSPPIGSPVGFAWVLGNGASTMLESSLSAPRPCHQNAVMFLMVVVHSFTKRYVGNTCV